MGQNDVEWRRFQWAHVTRSQNRTWHGMNLCMKVRFEVATKLAQKDVSLEVFQSFHRKLASNAFPFIARPCPIKCIVC